MKLNKTLTIEECKKIAEKDPNTLFIYENNTLGLKIDSVIGNPNWDWSVKPPSEIVE